MQQDLFITNDTIPEFSVSEISSVLKKVIEGNFSYVKVRGEISGYKKATSGHLYFSLKDENAVLNAVCFRNMAETVSFELEDGMSVVVSGKISAYEMRSNYQINAESVSLAGAGAIMEMLEKRRKKLEAEGLFAEENKNPIPFLPTTIGVITSPTGAVIQDIIHRLRDRFPSKVLLYPVLTQGNESAREVAKAVEDFNRFGIENDLPRPDVIIVARGGGSIEDLLPFSEEIVVRAVANSKIPIISAVGHETDYTLIDYASDLRAPTPSAAAEMAVPVLSDLQYTLGNLQNNCNTAFSRAVETKNYTLQILNLRLKSPAQILEGNIEKLKLISKTLNSSIADYFNNYQNKLELFSKLLNSYSYKETLKRGYAVVRSKSGTVISDLASLKKAETAMVEMYDGKVDISVCPVKAH